ncbi:MAG TPA: hypothetical protein VKA67_08435 [Verrucomicrobiae bacterium]|nr:hypothetical protein [Verrucomicrobiae bacterium]
MKPKRILRITSMLFVAGLLGGGCSKEAAAPTEPIVTNTPAPATPFPATNTSISPAPATNGAPQIASTVLTPERAKNHIGEEATVRGKVFGMHVTQKGDVFINFGAAFPNQLFTAVCFQGAIPTADLKKLNGKTVSVKGKIKDYNGRIEIVLESADQISE